MQVSLGTGVIWQTSPPIVKLSFSQGRRIRPNVTRLANEAMFILIRNLSVIAHQM